MARKTYNRTLQINSFVQGSAARELEPKRRVIERPYKSQEEILTERRRQRERERQIRRDNTRNLFYTIAVTGVVAVIFTICYQYLNLQAEINNNVTEIKDLKQQVIELTSDNNEEEDNINAGIDYQAIYNTAVNELGMIYPDKSQVITYDAGESQYVKQFMDIPGAK